MSGARGLKRAHPHSGAQAPAVLERKYCWVRWQSRFHWPPDLEWARRDGLIPGRDGRLGLRNQDGSAVRVVSLEPLGPTQSWTNFVQMIRPDLATMIQACVRGWRVRRQL